MRARLRALWGWITRTAARLRPWGRPRWSATALPAARPSPLQACASVVIPALNEAARIGDVVRYALSDPATAELIVIDDSSIDDTVVLARAAGATVVTSSMLGKGASMRDGVQLARRPLIVYLDGDLAGLRPGIVTDLCRPLVQGEADFVKARFGRGGARVTELTAKPMIKVFFPELAHFGQPLGGLVAARVDLLRTLPFEDAYGVDVGLLIDAHRAGARLAEVDIGSLEHDSQPLQDLTAMANEVSRVIFARARQAGRLHMEQISAMYESQRQAMASLDYILSRRRGRTRLLLLDMDGTVTPARFVVELARATGHEQALAALLDGDDDAATRSARIAALFRFVHREQFERVAQSLPLRDGVIACVNRLRRAGFMVGLVSDSYYGAAEVMRRRIFADFALAHTLVFDNEVCSGELRLNPAFLPPAGRTPATPDKGHVLRRLRDEVEGAPWDAIWAVGDHLNDLEMLRGADRAFVIDPKRPTLARDAQAMRLDAFDELAALEPLPASESRPATPALEDAAAA